ncbi:uncharacterized protein LOC125944206 [Dermacentor silvarum]|uniref:uncharacterized protein LOC125944206 n=1 Tax=Dermacentor silvarum TaxID=543639 RepID=UPI002100A364|nr:uncharacterized protein LOC125944206 [Dermacentor silvarum]
MALLNTRSLNAHDRDIERYPVITKADVLCPTETWSAARPTINGYYVIVCTEEAQRRFSALNFTEVPPDYLCCGLFSSIAMGPTAATSSTSANALCHAPIFLFVIGQGGTVSMRPQLNPLLFVLQVLSFSACARDETVAGPPLTTLTAAGFNRGFSALNFTEVPPYYPCCGLFSSIAMGPTAATSSTSANALCHAPNFPFVIGQGGTVSMRPEINPLLFVLQVLSFSACARDETVAGPPLTTLTAAGFNRGFSALNFTEVPPYYPCCGLFSSIAMGPTAATSSTSANALCHAPIFPFVIGQGGTVSMRPELNPLLFVLQVLSFSACARDETVPGPPLTTLTAAGFNRGFSALNFTEVPPYYPCCGLFSSIAMGPTAATSSTSANALCHAPNFPFVIGQGGTVSMRPQLNPLLFVLQCPKLAGSWFRTEFSQYRSSMLYNVDNPMTKAGMTVVCNRVPSAQQHNAVFI